VKIILINILVFAVGAISVLCGVVLGYVITKQAKEEKEEQPAIIQTDIEEDKAISSLQEQLNNLLRYDGTSKGQKEVIKFE